MSLFSPMGVALSLTGTALATAYPADSTLPIENDGNASRVRFYANFVKVGGSSVTTVTLKLRYRFNAADIAGSVPGAWLDLPSNTDATPTVFEIEHTFTVSAGSYYFYLDKPQALLDLAVTAKVNATGSVGDTLNVYWVAE